MKPVNGKGKATETTKAVTGGKADNKAIAPTTKLAKPDSRPTKTEAPAPNAGKGAIEKATPAAVPAPEPGKPTEAAPAPTTAEQAKEQAKAAKPIAGNDLKLTPAESAIAAKITKRGQRVADLYSTLAVTSVNEQLTVNAPVVSANIQRSGEVFMNAIFGGFMDDIEQTYTALGISREAGQLPAAADAEAVEVVEVSADA